MLYRCRLLPYITDGLAVVPYAVRAPGQDSGFLRCPVLRTQTGRRFATRCGVGASNAEPRDCAQDSSTRSAPAASYLRCAEPGRAGERNLGGPRTARIIQREKLLASARWGTRTKHPLQIRPCGAAQGERFGRTEEKPRKPECSAPRPGLGTQQDAGTPSKRSVLRADPENLQPPPPASRQPSGFWG